MSAKRYEAVTEWENGKLVEIKIKDSLAGKSFDAFKVTTANLADRSAFAMMAALKGHAAFLNLRTGV